jgi:hypothetical protein
VTDSEMLHALLMRGVPWPVAVEAAASTALDRDARARTHSLRDARLFELYCDGEHIYSTGDADHAAEWVRSDPTKHEARYQA